MLKRKYDESLYKKYVDGQNLVSKFKRQHSLKYDYSRVFKDISKDSYIVDVGCRDGQFVKHLHDKGYNNSYGADIGKKGMENAESAYGKAWVNKYLKCVDVQKEFPFDFQCDFINLSHTLEHFVFPEKAMSNMLSHLKQGGYMWIVVPSDLPDSGGAMAKLPKGSDYHWIFFKDEDGIKTFLSGLGLNVLSVRHVKEKVEKVGEWRVLCRKR